MNRKLQTLTIISLASIIFLLGGMAARVAPISDMVKYLDSAIYLPLIAKGPQAPQEGTIMAGAYVYCTNSGSLIRRSFNNVNEQTITISDGGSLGVCTIDFGFDISGRYVIATVTHPDTPLGVTVSAPPMSGNSVQLFVWHAGNIAPVAGGDVFVIVY